MSETQENPAPPPLFTALTTSSRQILTLLKCIGFQSKAQLQISADGLRVTVEDSHVMQGHAFIDKNLFNTYTFHPPPHLTEHLEEDEDPVVQFGISLTALLECLQIFGGGDAGGVIFTSPAPPHFTLSSTSPLGTTTVQFSNDGDLLETFMVSGRAKDVYRFDLVRHARVAMAVATKVSVRSDEAGVLSLQFMMEWEGRASFVDFRFLGVDEEEGGDGTSEGEEGEDSE
ncbi:hypothetical protein C7212DRAFT_364685 [Tuber magnatum]|uniref:Rad1-domain-containing protein n=1 Tax=Tuber magnatum TaxID=42249 RepID=A0A317SMG2_9PEZI|nr:hypothetical protein C7212DRAFT_364685 [Tuber magnatum]